MNINAYPYMLTLHNFQEIYRIINPFFKVRIFHEPVYHNLHSPEIEPSQSEIPQPKNWNYEISELESYFESAILPIQPIKLNPCVTILDVSKFKESHLANVKTNNGKQKFVPYLNRLQELRTIHS